MGLVNNQSYLIEKEDFLNFKFPNEEVLKDEKSKKKRMHNILNGVKLKEKFENKVIVYFEDSISLKKVETIIWGVTEKNLILKNNIHIPIKRVHNVIL